MLNKLVNDSLFDELEDEQSMAHEHARATIANKRRFNLKRKGRLLGRFRKTSLAIINSLKVLIVN